MDKRCFVISPIGAEGSDIREHADDVFEYIIQPAMKRLGFEAYRADHTTQLGKVSEQMFGSILRDDICVAILTGHNPNVFYELAVAQCAARPVIILIQKGDAIPFDIRDLRVVEYDLKPRPLREKVYENKIVEFTNSILSGAWKPAVPFGEGLSPLGAPQAASSLCEKAGDAPDSSNWEMMLGGSAEYFWISAVSLYGWSRNRGFNKTLRERCAAGCKVRILLLHPENPSLSNYLVGSAATLDQLVTEIGLARATLCRAGDSPNLELRLLKAAPHVQLTINEKLGLAYPYLLSKQRKEGPLMRAAAGGPLHQTLRDEYEFLWRDAVAP